LRKLGTVLHVSSQMNIIVRSDFTPDLGKRNVVTDKNMGKIGYIRDVIGPVNNPYVLIKAFNDIQDGSKLVGETVFMEMKKKIRQNKGKGRKY
jgi:rRNA processing protein Gar1